MGDVGWICRDCTYHNDGASSTCQMCYTPRSLLRQLALSQSHQMAAASASAGEAVRGNGAGAEHTSLSQCLSVCNVRRLLTGALSGALTGMFAIVGAFTGAVTGALAGRATDSGILRGAGLGAVAGAVLSVEVLEASRAYWHSDRSGPYPPSSVTEFIEELLNGRLSEQPVPPAMLRAHHWQVNVAEMSYEELYEMFGPGEGSIKGASEACLEKLPWFTITDNLTDPSGETSCCTICLQELLQGESARCLPSCHHVFHMSCVDKWLVRQGSCPICRHDIQV